MIQSVKHYALRLWITLVAAGLLSMVPLLLGPLPADLAWLMAPVALVFVLVFFFTGWIFNRLAIHQIERFRNEAAVWERAGKPLEAEADFKAALSVCDSFLLSPRLKRKSTHALTAQMVRFYFTRADRDPASEAFILNYLETNPGDAEFVESWLQQVDDRRLHEKKYQDIADRIATTLPDNRTIQHLLVRLYLSARRTDFPAQQLYRRALSAEAPPTLEIVRELAMVFLNEGRADERALDIYLQAYELDRQNDTILNGIAACFNWVPYTEKTADSLEKARKLLDGISEARLTLMRSGFIPPQLPLPAAGEKKKDRLRNVLKSVYRLSGRIVDTLESLFDVFLKTMHKTFNRIKTSPRSGKVLKWSLVGFLTAGLIVLLVNTFDYFVKNIENGKRRKDAGRAAAVVSDPYTLQVAAYLKPEHARQYMASLKKQNIDAYLKESVEKDKNWYQVRVSHFPDKKSAIEYGENLKSKGIISDFFVANY